MFGDTAAVTFIRALPGEGATLRSLLEKDAVRSFRDGGGKPEILTCAVDADFICLKEAEETGFVSLSDETKCCIASLMVVVGGDVNRDVFH
jgi:cytochrome b involved in lipid metabolism